MSKYNLTITEISWEDFQKLNLKAWERRKHYYDDKGRRINYDEAYVKVPEQIVDGKVVKEHYYPIHKYTKIAWDEININDIVKYEIDAILAGEFGDAPHNVCVAIHLPPSEEFLNDIYNNCPYTVDALTGKPLTDSMKKQLVFFDALDEWSYLDKWMTREGPQTYLLRDCVEKLYSTRDYYEIRDDYFKIPKRYTKAVYLIKF